MLPVCGELFVAFFVNWDGRRTIDIGIGVHLIYKLHELRGTNGDAELVTSHPQTGKMKQPT